VPEFTAEEIIANEEREEAESIKYNLRSTDIWLFRMVLELWEIGKTKGLWTNADITDDALKQKASDWKAKLERLEELGE